MVKMNTRWEQVFEASSIREACQFLRTVFLFCVPIQFGPQFLEAFISEYKSSKVGFFILIESVFYDDGQLSTVYDITEGK